jgi:hypothetical protein
MGFDFWDSLERRKNYIWVPFSWVKRILRVKVCGSSGNSQRTQLP